MEQGQASVPTGRQPGQASVPAGRQPGQAPGASRLLPLAGVAADQAPDWQHQTTDWQQHTRLTASLRFRLLLASPSCTA